MIEFIRVETTKYKEPHRTSYNLLRSKIENRKDIAGIRIDTEGNQVYIDFLDGTALIIEASEWLIFNYGDINL
jgi:hypothetical protein